MSSPAPRGRLRWKLLGATLPPTVLALGLFGFWAQDQARRVLEDEMGKRLGTAAAGVALTVLPEQITAIGPGDEASRTYAGLKRRLESARGELGIRRVALVARDLAGRGDTDGRIALGATAHEFAADHLEIERAGQGQPTSSPLFVGLDGLPYKRGYAAVGNPPVGFVVVEASAGYIAALASFRRWLFAAGGLALGLVVLVTVFFARRMTAPLDRLASAADRIGRGDLGTPVVGETADEIGLLAARLDQMRGALKARDERLQMMLAGIAHEVRNPLGGLELYAGLLRDALGGQTDRLEEVARIEREIGHLKTVVSDFLDYARRPPLNLEQVHLRALLADLVPLCPEGAPVVVEIDRELQVRADPAQLRRALLNLVKNAVAAAGSAGRVVVTAETTAAGTVIHVRDSGPGVPADLHEQIFVPFFTTKEKGTGLGLAFVREIARAHGGDVTVARAPEGGADFSFTLPAV